MTATSILLLAISAQKFAAVFDLATLIAVDPP